MIEKGGFIVKKRLLALLLVLVTLSGLQIASAVKDKGVYALMAIPYSLFYEAETTGGKYDSVSSATRVKPLMMEYAGGSFHYMTDGREITGVIFPVYAASENLLKSYGGRKITDKTKVTVTVNNKGKKKKTTYKGKDALFQSDPFSYYILSETPAVYKELGKNCDFGPMQGLVVELEGKVSLISSKYAKVCVRVDGADEVLTGLNVNAAVLEAEDGTRVGMKHIENIWLKTSFGFNLDSEVYRMLKGKNLKSVELYTFDAKYVIPAGDGVKIK